MSAIVCGKRSGPILGELHHTPPPAAKRIRRSSARPSPPRASASALGHLRSLFPGMDQEILERALEASGNDLDSAIKSLNDLHLESLEINLGSAASESDGELETNVQQSSEAVYDFQLIERVLKALGNNIDNAIKSLKYIQSGYVEGEPESPAQETTAENLVIENLPTDGSGWVELFVREMMGASGIDHARARAARVLELLEKSIITCAGAKEAESFHEENKMLKERLEAVLHDNSILKRGIAILHEHQKDYDAKSQELEQLKQTLSQYREQVKTLEINNYALTMHLKQAQQNSSIPGRFHPDVF